jgi:hypothetical protein
MLVRALRRYLVSPETIILFMLLFIGEAGLNIAWYSMAVAGLMFVDSAIYLKTAIHFLIFALMLVATVFQSIQSARDFYQGLVYPWLEAAGSRKKMITTQILASTLRWILVMTILYIGIVIASFRFWGSGFLQIEDMRISAFQLILRATVSWIPAVFIIFIGVASGFLCAQVQPGGTAISVLLSFSFWAVFTFTGGFLLLLPALTDAYRVARWNEIAVSLYTGIPAGFLLGISLLCTSCVLFAHRDIHWKMNSK